jgi:hypothetical protein
MFCEDCTFVMDLFDKYPEFHEFVTKWLEGELTLSYLMSHAAMYNKRFWVEMEDPITCETFKMHF